VTRFRLTWWSTALAVAVLALALFATLRGGGAFATSVIGPLLLAAIILASVAALAYRREKNLQRYTTTPGRQLTRLTTPLARTTSGLSEAGGGVATVLTLDVDRAKRPSLPVAVMRQPAVKLCPKCSREYQTGLEKCPFDGERLVESPDPNAQSQPQDTLDTQRSIMACGECAREYDLGVSFCCYDGERLHLAEVQDGRVYFDGVMECPECGAAADSDLVFCPDDGARLEPKRAGRTHVSYASIPLMICPTCASEYKPGKTTCPHDETKLLPLIGRTTGADPGRGRGDRVMYCETCSLRFGEDAEYCSTDGQALIRLN